MNKFAIGKKVQDIGGHWIGTVVGWIYQSQTDYHSYVVMEEPHPQAYGNDPISYSEDRLVLFKATADIKFPKYEAFMKRWKDYKKTGDPSEFHHKKCPCCNAKDESKEKV